MWIHLDLIKGMLDFCETLYPVVNYAYTTIPTYPCGQIGFVMCSLDTVSSVLGLLQLYAVQTLYYLWFNYLCVFYISYNL